LANEEDDDDDDDELEATLLVRREDAPLVVGIERSNRADEKQSVKDNFMVVVVLLFVGVENLRL
jgi:hypothetical protein